VTAFAIAVHGIVALAGFVAMIVSDDEFYVWLGAIACIINALILTTHF